MRVDLINKKRALTTKCYYYGQEEKVFNLKSH